MQAKPKFVEKYTRLLGSKKNYEKFNTCNFTLLRRSIRVNTLKISVKELVKRIEKNWTLEPIKWCKEGFYMSNPNRRDIGNTIEYQLGYYYVQEAASMLPPLVLDPKPGETVLDMCAAPGSKTTQMAAMMKNKGVIVANEPKGKRIASLGINVQRCGATNIVFSIMPGQRMKGQKFDKILVDAPCSGTGAIRKSLKTLQIWNPTGCRSLAGIQKQLLSVAYACLKPGGIVVYSTCSLEPEEDEEVIDSFLNFHPDAKLLPINLPIKKGKPVLEYGLKKYNPEIKKVLRIWPQDNDTEGFFVAKIQKSSQKP